MPGQQGILPLRTTKAGAGDKEPAFIVLRTHACKFLSLLILLSVLVALKLYHNESQFEKYVWPSIFIFPCFLYIEQHQFSNTNQFQNMCIYDLMKYDSMCT
jgi:hypothetical protein